jgi:hypothetical protein
MLILSSTSHTIEAKLTGAPTTPLEYAVSYVDVTTTTYTPIGDAGTIPDATNTTIIAAPGDGSTQRQIKQITIYNADNATATVAIQKYNGTTRRIACKVTLLVGQTLQYNDGEGFKITDERGGEKTSRVANLAISAGTQSVSSRNVSFVNSNGITWGLSDSSQLTMSLSRPTASFFEPYSLDLQANAVATNSAAANVSLYRFMLPYYMTVNRLDLIANLTVAASESGTWSVSVGLYTRAGSTLSSAFSTYSGIAFASLGTTSDTGSYRGLSGVRFRTFSANNWNLTPGEYWFGVINSVQGPSGTTGSVSFYGRSSYSIQGALGTINDVIGIGGLYSGASGAFSSEIRLSEIFYASNSGNTCASLNKFPYFRMFGTF